MKLANEKGNYEVNGCYGSESAAEAACDRYNGADTAELEHAVTYTNGASMVAFQAKGDSYRVVINERVEILSPAAALDFEEALIEAGYQVWIC